MHIMKFSTHKIYPVMGDLTADSYYRWEYDSAEYFLVERIKTGVMNNV